MNIHKSLPAVVKIFHFSARRPSGRVSFCQPVKNIQETAKKVRGGRQTILQRIRYQTHSHQLSQHNVVTAATRPAAAALPAPRAAPEQTIAQCVINQCSAALPQIISFSFLTFGQFCDLKVLNFKLCVTALTIFTCTYIGMFFCNIKMRCSYKI